MGSIATTLAKALTCTFSMRGIFLITHSFSWFRVSQTLVRYWAMCPSLALYSPWMCPTISWESLRISILETERASVRFNSDMIASYSASLLNVENASRMAYSSCSLVGDCRRRSTPDPDAREAPSTWRIHHPSLHGSTSWEDWGISAMKYVMTWPFMDNLGWYLIPYSLNSITHFNILPDRSGLCKILLRG